MIKFSNIWKAWLTTVIGIVIPVITGIASDFVSGHISWAAVKVAVVPALALILTDLLKEVEKQLNNQQ